MTKRTPKRIPPRISKPDESREQCTKTMLEGKTCDWDVCNGHQHQRCGKPAVEQAHNSRHSIWVCAEHFAKLLAVAIMNGEG